jgi:type VI secretion system VasD/TssJ family lipoprotein
MQAYTKHRPVSIPALRRALALLLAGLLSAGFLAGCGSAPPPKPALQSEDPDAVVWAYGEKALQLRLSAARDLNSFEDKAHTLQLCVYQLDKRDAFDLLKDTQDGINTLLHCSAFDKSVKGATRIFLQPGETAMYTLDRAEGTLFLSVVCGFFDSTPAQSARLWPIPPKETQSGHLFWKSTVYSAGGLALSLHLNAHALEEDSAGQNAREQGEKNQGQQGSQGGNPSGPQGQGGNAPGPQGQSANASGAQGQGANTPMLTSPGQSANTSTLPGQGMNLPTPTSPGQGEKTQRPQREIL